MKETYVFLAAGFEEIEALSAVDILRRANINVHTVSITDALQVTGAHGVTVTADVLFSDTNFDTADWLVIPGGMPGATNLADYAPLMDLLKRHAAAGRHIASICASPAVVLCKAGLLDGRKATCYPGMEDTCSKAIWTGEPVVVDEQFVLGNGPANAMLWSIAIVEQAAGAETARDVASGMLFYPPKGSDMEFSFG